jgi:hypothetical protein
MSVAAETRPSSARAHRHAVPAGAVRRAGIACGVVVAAVPFAAQLIFILRASAEQLRATMPDDSFYYLEIARRAADGQGFTFDGVNATSGFHPLWEWLLVPLNLVVAGDTAYVRAARLLSLVMLAAAFVIVTRLIWRTGGAAPALAAACLAAHQTTVLTDATSGMETALVALCLAVLLWSLERFFRDPTDGRAFAAGLAAAVLVLARLDMVLVLPIVLLVVVVRLRSVRSTVVWLAGGLAVGVPYAIWHTLTVGAVLTTSASIKRRWTSEFVELHFGSWFTGSHLHFLLSLTTDLVRLVIRDVTDGPLGTLIGRLAAAGAMFLATVGVLDAEGRRRAGGRKLGPTGVAAATVGAMVATKLLVDVVTVPVFVQLWYSTVARLAAGFALGTAIGVGGRYLWVRYGPKVAPLLGLTVLVLVPAGVSDTLDGRIGYAWQMESDRAAAWISDNGPAGTYGAFDAGLLGYRLHDQHRLINLDGLVNDAEFARFSASGPTLVELLDHDAVDFLVGDFTDRRRETELACAETLWQGDLTLRPDAAEYGPDRVYVLDVRPCR